MAAGAFPHASAKTLAPSGVSRKNHAYAMDFSRVFPAALKDLETPQLKESFLFVAMDG